MFTGKLRAITPEEAMTIAKRIGWKFATEEATDFWYADEADNIGWMPNKKRLDNFIKAMNR